MLSSTQAGPGRTVKQEQEEISRNHVQTFICLSVVFSLPVDREHADHVVFTAAERMHHTMAPQINGSFPFQGAWNGIGIEWAQKGERVCCSNVGKIPTNLKEEQKKSYSRKTPL